MVHFLGGVFVSPQPENAYRYLLESLANRGYVVIATPFTVDFEYRKPAAEIHAKFTAAKALLEAEAGDARARRGSGSIASLPQFALGHSLGALMQVLLCCTYAEYAQSCTGSALLSYNNKPASEAIPAFEQLFVPALAPLEPLTRTAAYTGAIEGARALRQFGFGLARAGLERASPLLSGGGGQGGAASSSAASTVGADVAAQLEVALRDAEALASLADQVPALLADIASGTSEFTPAPEEMRSLVGSAYSRPRSPLVVQFSVDSLDESPGLMSALPDAAGARKIDLEGTHLTPLAVDPNAPSSALLPIPEALGGGGLRARLLGDVDTLVGAVDDHFRARIGEVQAEADAEVRRAAEEARAREVAAAAEAEAKVQAEEAAAEQAAKAKAEAERAAKAKLKEAASRSKKARVVARVADRAAASRVLAERARAATGGNGGSGGGGGGGGGGSESGARGKAAQAGSWWPPSKRGRGGVLAYSTLKAAVVARREAKAAQAQASAAEIAARIATVESRMAEMDGLVAQKGRRKRRKAKGGKE